MKTNYKLLLGLLLFAPLLSFAQQKGSGQKATPKASSDCFKEWYTIFRERGGKPVTDGTHEAIISLRNTHDGTSKCYIGKIEVVNGRIKPPMWVQKVDGSYDTFAAISGKQLDPAFVKSMSEEELLTISEGMSINMKTSDMEYGRVLFYTFLNDKPKALKEAPSPASLIKN
jgi:hypothetical protein